MSDMQCEDVKNVYVVFVPGDDHGFEGGVLGVYTTLDGAIKNITEEYNQIIEVELNKPVTDRFNLLEGKCVWELTQKM